MSSPHNKPLRRHNTPTNSPPTYTRQGHILGGSINKPGNNSAKGIPNTNKDHDDGWRKKQIREKRNKIAKKVYNVMDNNNTSAAYDCLSILRTIVYNIVHYPDNPKYRRIKKRKRPIQTKILRINGGESALLSIGFRIIVEEFEEVYYFKDDNYSNNNNNKNNNKNKSSKNESQQISPQEILENAYEVLDKYVKILQDKLEREKRHNPKKEDKEKRKEILGLIESDFERKKGKKWV